MEFVLDTSVTMSWCFEDEATPYTEATLDRLQGATAVVPSIWPLEVANVLLSAERRGRLTEAQSTRFIELLGALPIVMEQPSVDRVLGAVLLLGRQHALSAYDAAYLELAARHGLPLATRDERIVTAAAAIGVKMVQLA
ncbi:MAG: type II toxin-antitoxin system VapC family toxin [bacterium]|nr:type II toxin-antitoxin system VapC family toxin [bacterium]